MRNICNFAEKSREIDYGKVFRPQCHFLFAMSGMKPIFRGVLAFCTACFLMVCCAPHSSSESETLREEANELYNDKQYQEALGKYEKALAKAQGNDRLVLRQDIIDCHQALGNQTKVRELLKTQLEEAHAAGDIQMEAEAMNTLGLQIYETGDKQTAYDYMTQAVRLMEKSTAEDAPYLLAYYHYVLMKRRTVDEDYAQALIDAKAVEKYLAQSPQPEKGEPMLVRTLGTMAHLYCMTDSTAKADSIYGVWQQHLPMAVSDERDICPYLTHRGRYQEVIDIQRRHVEWVREKKGKWTDSELTAKYQMAEAEAALGHGDEAFRLLKESYEINDTLLARQAEENLKKISDYYVRLNNALPELFSEVPRLNEPINKQAEEPLPDPEGDPAQLMRNIYTIQNRYLPHEDIPDRTSVPEEEEKVFYPSEAEDTRAAAEKAFESAAENDQASPDISGEEKKE